MFCPNCGQEQSDEHKFCKNCGTNLSSESHSAKNSSPNNFKSGNILGKNLVACIVVVCIVFAFVFALFSFTHNKEEETLSGKPAHSEEVNSSIPTEQPALPENGWHTENGKQYYYTNGEMCVSIQEIDGDYYYFNEDGTLASDIDLEYEGLVLKVGSDGIIDRVVFETITGEWSDERYKYGNNGKALILELEFPIEDCTAMTFYVAAQGQRGARANGKWEIYGRHNGQWEFIKEIDYTEPEGRFEIEFESPKSFEAITACPQILGNATLEMFFCLQNVDCPFQVLLNLSE